MTFEAERFKFVERDMSLGLASLAPLLPITLLGRTSILVSGLLDTGATVNVLPNAVGKQLGAVWNDLTTRVTLSSNLADCEARAVIVTAVVSKFPAVRLAFAWSNTDDVPVLLGQVNFFMEFDVCFYRSRSEFDVRPKQAIDSPT